MPIAYFPDAVGPGGVTDTLRVKPPGAVLDPAPPTPILVGHAVYLADAAGTPTIYLCGAALADRPDLFMGFIETLGAIPGGTIITTGRGSYVQPHVQGGGLLTVNQEIWLSTTAGEVTQTAPVGVSQAIVRVGVATSTTEIILTTDFRQAIP